ncbi:hypothetical protein BC826DRAFT_973175 [Russula brevipes]|nr:hypothetical protein BC826DRAFT_973175 [Russula brevipes]
MHVLYDEHNVHFHLHALCGERSSERQPLSALGCKQYIPLELEAVVTKNPMLPRRDTYTFGGSRQRLGEVDVRESDPIRSGSAVRRQLFIRIRQCRPFPCAAASANPPWCLYRAIWICHGSDSQLRTEIPSPKTRAPSAESVDMRMTIRTGRVCDGDNERRSHSEFARHEAWLRGNRLLRNKKKGRRKRTEKALPLAKRVPDATSPHYLFENLISDSPCPYHLSSLKFLCDGVVSGVVGKSENRKRTNKRRARGWSRWTYQGCSDGDGSPHAIG